MAPKTITSSPLTVPKSDAQKKIQLQINKGKDLLKQKINTTLDLESLEAGKDRWHGSNKLLFSQIFHNESILKVYDEPHVDLLSLGALDFAQKSRRIIETIEKRVGMLVSILNELKSLPEESSECELTENRDTKFEQSILLIPGTNQDLNKTIIRDLKKLNLNLVTTPRDKEYLLEELESFSGVNVALVLLTPDDVGSTRDKPESLSSRAGQNTLGKLFYLAGKMGLQKVWALYEQTIQLPLLFTQINSIQLDKEGSWKLKLIEVLKQKLK